MLELMMYFTIGFLAAGIVALVVIPRVHGRAVRLTTRRLEAAIPPSITEVQAEKDLQRAEFAMSTCRLEASVEQLNERYTSQLVELGRKSDALGRLKLERDAQHAEIVALKIEVEALRAQLAQTANDLSAAGLGAAGDAGAARTRSQPDIRVAHEGQAVSTAPRTGGPTVPQIHSPPLQASQSHFPSIDMRPSDYADEHFAAGRRSKSGGALRTVARFCIALALGVGAAVAGQYSSDDIRTMILSWAEAPGRLPSLPAPASAPASVPTPVAVATTAEPAANAGAVTSNPADARPSVEPVRQEPPAAGQTPPAPRPEQPAAKLEQPVRQEPQKQEQVVRQAPPAQAVEPEARPTAVAPAAPQPRASASARSTPEARPTTPYPETKPTTIPGWRLRDVNNGIAVVEGPNGVWRVGRGDTVPGVGRVESIVRWGGRWLVATSSGLISTP